nr:hypothetical protein [Tanacetum cinerariifolium]
MVKPVWNNAHRVNHQNFAKKTHPCAKKNMVSRAVLMKSGLESINTARQNTSKTALLVNNARQVIAAHSKTTVNAARPMSYLSKTTHSTFKRPIHKNTALKNSNVNQRDQGVIDSGCSRHMTRNMSYLIDYEEINKGYVAFGGNPKRGKIIEKAKKRFWSTAMAKTINGEAPLHAKVDGKKIIVTESSVTRDLRLADEEGIDYLPNSTIFEQIALMGFMQTFLDTQLNDLSTHKRIYIASSYTKKIFRNMRRVEKGFSGKVTPLFQTMVQQLGEGSAILTDPQHTPTIIPPLTQPQKTQKPRKPIRKDTQVPQASGPTESVVDEAVHKELGNRLVRAATTASSLEAEQDSGNITKTQSKATPNEPSSQGTDLVGGPRCQETIGDTTTQTRFENVSKHSNDSLLARGNTLQSDEDSLKLD